MKTKFQQKKNKKLLFIIMASAAPSFLAAHQEGGTVQRLAAGMRDDDGEYKVSYLIFLFCNNINVLLHTCCLFMTMLFSSLSLFSIPVPSEIRGVGSIDVLFVYWARAFP